MTKLTCPKCNAIDVVKRGKRYNKIKAKQLYRCNECRTVFVEPDGFERMRHKPDDIVRAIHQYNDGLTLFKVKNHLWQHDNVSVSRWTISKWHKKYSDFLKSAEPKSAAKTQRKAAL
jgi:transposase-like protein